jgi:hypothetical protein
LRTLDVNNDLTSNPNNGLFSLSGTGVIKVASSSHSDPGAPIVFKGTILGWGTVTPNQREGFAEIEKFELYLGPSWNDEIFTAPNSGGLIGIRTSAWGSFLATGCVTFKDGRAPLILDRYIDFEMAPKNTP